MDVSGTEMLRRTDYVEARSLSATNYLAANPPQYPVNPAEEPREPLTLYISRVPGSRDVILSTFKPQKKNVTGEDVANSLYYVHLDLPLNELLSAPDPIRGPASPRSSIESARSVNVIHRKPLPATATVPPLQSHVSEGNILDLGRPSHPGYESSRKPASIQQPSTDPRHEPPAFPPRPTQQFHSSVSAPIVRKPLGPRQMGVPPPVPEKDPLQPPNVPPISRPAAAAPAPVFKTEPFVQEPAQVYPDLPDIASSRSPSPTKRSRAFVPFSLTIIRRDPTSGHQWNIGKVTSMQTNLPADVSLEVFDPSPQDRHRPRGHPIINVHVETSGYAKFRGMPTRQSIDTFRPGSSSSLPPSLGGYGAGGTSTDDVTNHRRKPAEEGFTRQVAMSYTKSWTSNLRQAFKRRPRSRSVEDDDPDTFEPPQPPPLYPFGTHTRQDSANSTRSTDSALSTLSADPAAYGADSHPLITQPGPGLKARGYVFTSPWGGQCEFHTGNGGRSLKCQHFLSSGGGAFNPLVLTQGARERRSREGSLSGGMSSSAASVSELRFNLPSGDLFKKSGKADGRELHGRLEKLLKLDGRHEYWSSGDEEEDGDGPSFFLSLGKEKAGGGNRGKRAKLGKLIVYDEGLKMLDLVVAANIGLWWGAWEKRA